MHRKKGMVSCYGRASYLLFKLFKKHLLSCGVARANIVQVELDKKKDAALRQSDALYKYIGDRLKGRRGNVYVFIDEIQECQRHDARARRVRCCVEFIPNFATIPKNDILWLLKVREDVMIGRNCDKTKWSDIPIRDENHVANIPIRDGCRCS